MKAVKQGFRSESQRRRLREMVNDGLFSEVTFRRWERITGDTVLPERRHPFQRFRRMRSVTRHGTKLQRRQEAKALHTTKRQAANAAD